DGYLRGQEEQQGGTRHEQRGGADQTQRRNPFRPRPFLLFKTGGPGRYWILSAWLPFFVLNIAGEEFVWRGVVLPRQEVAFGRRAWLVNGLLWLLFHAAFPWQVLVTLVPITLILPYVVQRRRSTWAGVIIDRKSVV